MQWERACAQSEPTLCKAKQDLQRIATFLSHHFLFQGNLMA